VPTRGPACDGARSPSLDGRWRRFSADYTGQSARLLDDIDELERCLQGCLTRAGLQLEVWIRHRFHPQGVSLLGLGESGRVALHTWPELRSATVDLWTVDTSGSEAMELCARLFGPPG
jgi:S-adenosylmethionine/arginine decarboxylase-like enzyme